MLVEVLPEMRLDEVKEGLRGVLAVDEVPELVGAPASVFDELVVELELLAHVALVLGHFSAGLLHQIDELFGDLDAVLDIQRELLQDPLLLLAVGFEGGELEVGSESPHPLEVCPPELLEKVI